MKSEKSEKPLIGINLTPNQVFFVAAAQVRTSSWPPFIENETYKIFGNYSELNVPYTVVNKKVLLPERKRHTARRVASDRYAALSNGGGYLPPTIQTWMGYPPNHPDLAGVPPPPTEVWTDKQTENSTFPHPSDAGGNYVQTSHGILWKVLFSHATSFPYKTRNEAEHTFSYCFKAT